MKTYTKPEISKVELFTQDSIALAIPKTKYNFGTQKADLISVALQAGESISGTPKSVE